MYSKTLGQAVPNFCVKCETKFQRWDTYHAHVTTNACTRSIKPVRVTDRRTGVDVHGWAKEGTIVGDWEVKNKGALIK